MAVYGVAGDGRAAAAPASPAMDAGMGARAAASDLPGFWRIGCGRGYDDAGACCTRGNGLHNWLQASRWGAAGARPAPWAACTDPTANPWTRCPSSQSSIVAWPLFTAGLISIALGALSVHKK